MLFIRAGFGVWLIQFLFIALLLPLLNACICLMYISSLLILQYKLTVARETVMAAMVLLIACCSNELSAELNQTVLGGIASAGKTAVLVLMLYTCSNANEENICRIMHVISLMVFGSNDQVGNSLIHGQFAHACLH